MNNIVKNIISEISGYEIEELKENDFLEEDLGFDSIMLMDLYRTILSSVPEATEQNLPKDTFKKDHSIQMILQLIQPSNYEKSVSDEVEISQLDEISEIKEFDHYYKNMEGKIPYFRENKGIPTNKIVFEKNEIINFSTYNYLGLNGSLEVSSFAKQAIDVYGTSVSGSRLLSGEIPLHRELEEKIASFIGVEDSLVQVGGHSTNVNVISSLVSEGDLILHDALAHNSIIQGALFSGAKRMPFKHNNMDSLEKELSRLRNKFDKVLIVVEGVYSMDGDICDLPNLIALKEKYNAILMVDEAHSFGTIGKNGKGVTSYFNIPPHKVDILMGTLSKSASSCGGYIAGSSKYVNYLKYNLEGFIFSCGITPPNAAAALKSIQLFEERQDFFESLDKNSASFLKKLKNLGFETGMSKDTPVIPLITRDSNKALLISQQLFENGINAMPIVYPAVKENEARIRFFISAAHTDEDINKTISVLKKIKERSFE